MVVEYYVMYSRALPGKRLSAHGLVLWHCRKIRERDGGWDRGRNIGKDRGRDKGGLLGGACAGKSRLSGSDYTVAPANF
jgi:hypothetical protein